MLAPVMAEAAVQFTSQVGLGSLVAIFTILGFFGGLMNFMYRIARKIDKVDEIPDQLKDLRVAFEDASNVLRNVINEGQRFREQTETWQANHERFLHEQLRQQQEWRRDQRRRDQGRRDQDRRDQE